MQKHILLFAVLLVVSTLYAKKDKLPDHMAKADPPKEIERVEDKAVLVIHTNTKFHFIKARYDYYIDDNLVGQDNKREVYFTVQVEPGTRWFFCTIKDNIMNTARFTLEAGKIYYLLRKSVPGGNVMLTQTPEDFAKYLKELEPLYLVFKPSGEPEKLPDKVDEDDIQEEKEDFEEDVKEDPEKHADVLNFKGY